MTIAESLDGKETMPDKYKYDTQTGIYTFEDGSQGKIISYSEPCNPRQVGVVTVGFKTTKKWKKL